jgi:hypothetical protein
MLRLNVYLSQLPSVLWIGRVPRSKIYFVASKAAAWNFELPSVKASGASSMRFVSVSSSTGRRDAVML